MNFAYVRVEGVVLTYPSLIAAKENPSLSFRIRDADGEMRVSAFGSIARTLLEAHAHSGSAIPMPGDKVVAEGTLRIRDDEPSLLLNAAQAVWVTPQPVQAMPLAGLAATHLGERISTQGQVRRVRHISDALSIISLRDGSATGDLLIPLGLQSMLGDVAAPTPSLGTWISVTGSVGEYRGERQLMLTQARDLEVQHTRSQPISLRPVAALGKNMLGRWVAVMGIVADLRPMQQGMRIDVQDSAGDRITVVAFDAIWDSVSFSQTLEINDTLIVEGELAEFRGELEILPELGLDLAVP